MTRSTRLDGAEEAHIARMASECDKMAREMHVEKGDRLAFNLGFAAGCYWHQRHPDVFPPHWPETLEQRNARLAREPQS